MVIVQEKKKFEAAHSRGQLNKCADSFYEYLDEDGTNFYRFYISDNRCSAFTVLDRNSYVYLQSRDTTEEEINLINKKIKEASANTEKEPKISKTIESDIEKSNWSSYSPLKRPEPIDYRTPRMFQINRTVKCVPNSKSFDYPDIEMKDFSSKSNFK